MVRKTGERVELVSRNGNPLNRSFPEVVAAIAELPGDFVLDAELTVDLPTGHSSFERLRRRAVTSIESRVRTAMVEHPARLYLFDMMASNGRDLRGLPLVTRKEHLRGCFENTATLIFATGIVAAGHWVLNRSSRTDWKAWLRSGSNRHISVAGRATGARSSTRVMAVPLRSDGGVHARNDFQDRRQPR
ncbi:hypothetical protein [Burkholderia stagnalis]|uniref:ATP-dependent DNA ligase n=1 Tax=Burkholderia stagnalis TaxID=1503054 RepID=UPI000AE58FBB|nr:hypothetical protein [Burkholderia stagnalis]